VAGSYEKLNENSSSVTCAEFLG